MQTDAAVLRDGTVGFDSASALDTASAHGREQMTLDGVYTDDGDRSRGRARFDGDDRWRG